MDTCGSIFTQAFLSGDDILLNFQFLQSDGITAKPMTGYVVGLTIKTSLTDSNGNLTLDSAAVFQKDLAGDATGIFHYTIPGQTTGQPTLNPGTFFLDLKQWDSTSKRTTVLTTKLPINQSVALRSTPATAPSGSVANQPITIKVLPLVSSIQISY